MRLTKQISLGALFVVWAASAWANNTPQSLPFVQDWSNTGLITTNDDWSGVPGIVGFRGDGLTASNGTDPQTITAESTVIDVIANQSTPDTSNNLMGGQRYNLWMSPLQIGRRLRGMHLNSNAGRNCAH